MTKTTNARINDVLVGLNDRGALTCGFSLDSNEGGTAWQFVLSKPSELAKLTQLLNYTDVSDVNKLNGKLVRIIVKNNALYALGDPIEDNFFKVYGDFATTTYEELA